MHFFLSLVLLVTFSFAARADTADEASTSYIFGSKDLDQFRSPLYKMALSV